MFTSNGKKSIILQVLQKQAFPITLKELLVLLPEGFAERSVRRWLGEMVLEGVLDKRGQRRGTRYHLVSVPAQSGGCFSPESLEVVAQVRRPVFERNPVSYQEQWLSRYEPNKTYYLPAHIRSELLQRGKRSREEDPAGSYAHQIYNRLLIDLSYNSSRLEGNTYSLVETEKLVLEGKEAEHRSEDEKTMILNHKEAIRFLVDSAPQLKISTKVVFTVHYLLSDGLVDPSLSGKVRNHDVRIGGSTYIPYNNPRKLSDLLESITDKAALIRDPFEQSFFFLVHLSYLQPFTDVNKRTARLCANLPLIQHNLVPLSFNDIEKEDYASAIIAIYELQQIRPLLDLFRFSYRRTCILYESTIQSLGIDIVRVRYRKQRRQLISEIILQKKVGPSMNKYIRAQARQQIPAPDCDFFIEDVYEDLKALDENRIYGLGVTLEDLKAWQKLIIDE